MSFQKAKHEFYSNLEISVQAEPCNPVDNNAVAVLIENVQAKIDGNPWLEKAGYIRALAAKILRESNPEKFSYNGKLVRPGEKEIVVQVSV